MPCTPPLSSFCSNLTLVPIVTQQSKPLDPLLPNNWFQQWYQLLHSSGFQQWKLIHEDRPTCPTYKAFFACGRALRASNNYNNTFPDPIGLSSDHVSCVRFGECPETVLNHLKASRAWIMRMIIGIFNNTIYIYINGIVRAWIVNV